MLKLKCESPARWTEDEIAQADMSPVSLSSARVQLGAELLARVFQHDPMTQHLVADSVRLLDKPMRFYRATIRMGLLSGEVHTTPQWIVCPSGSVPATLISRLDSYCEADF